MAKQKKAKKIPIQKTPLNRLFWLIAIFLILLGTLYALNQKYLGFSASARGNNFCERLNRNKCATQSTLCEWREDNKENKSKDKMEREKQKCSNEKNIKKQQRCYNEIEKASKKSKYNNGICVWQDRWKVRFNTGGCFTHGKVLVNRQQVDGLVCKQGKMIKVQCSSPGQNYCEYPNDRKPGKFVMCDDYGQKKTKNCRFDETCSPLGCMKIKGGANTIK